MIAVIIIGAICFLALLAFIFLGRKSHRQLGGLPDTIIPIPYNPDEHGADIDPGMISAALAFQTGEMCFLNNDGSKWTIQSASGISGEGSTAAEAYKQFMERYNESKTGVRK